MTDNEIELLLHIATLETQIAALETRVAVLEVLINRLALETHQESTKDA